ncbi:hypothetical protein MIND_01428200 [Mycena indigotica]|uniref:YTH domain-containing protein n=1 Tax=Mycena indigotica TaxID=2126181 RepID=A0A8H6VQT2_9AGAR|nr:uncharacterized protein MIND_01428200 [Mycena indigotica]KAF7288616.1 hypothetical protein MIND_01428200 [Mycena indigotica]
MVSPQPPQTPPTLAPSDFMPNDGQPPPPLTVRAPVTNPGELPLGHSGVLEDQEPVFNAFAPTEASGYAGLQHRYSPPEAQESYYSPYHHHQANSGSLPYQMSYQLPVQHTGFYAQQPHISQNLYIHAASYPHFFPSPTYQAYAHAGPSMGERTSPWWPQQQPSQSSPHNRRSPHAPIVGAAHGTPALPVSQPHLQRKLSQRSPQKVPDPAHQEGSGKQTAKPLVRREYHPNPPVRRSDWVMWAGNVPSDAKHDELWRFFTSPSQLPPPADASTVSPESTQSSPPPLPTTTTTTASDENDLGVLSIFLISRSNCAFVNYETESQLQAAIERFDGVRLRPADSRCPRLVCKVRKKDDDLNAGVGGQRGMGMHTGWVKANKASRRASGSGGLSALTEVSRPGPTPLSSRSGSGSHASASTDSSMLRENFPQRYFILKSLTRDDLELSIKTGLWATQKHNEGVLDRAFRTSEDVFLIFSVNKSGEFYGYAKMAGPISRSNGSPSESTPWTRRSPVHPANTPSPLLSSSHFVDESPLPLSSARASNVQSAPAILGPRERVFSAASPAVKYSLDHHLFANLQSQPAVIELDETAPVRAMRSRGTSRTSSGPVLPLASTPSPAGGDTAPRPDRVIMPENADTSWGSDFALTWICTARLPFTRTRMLRNPWNHDREVKVSRDGTELEPGVGKALLEEWQAYIGSTAMRSTIALCHHVINSLSRPSLDALGRVVGRSAPWRVSARRSDSDNESPTGLQRRATSIKRANFKIAETPSDMAIPKTTRQYIVQTPGSLDALKLVEVAIPALKATEVLVRTKAVSLQFRDLMVAHGTYPHHLPPNLVPCSDMAGEVIAVGVEVTQWKTGDRVMANFFLDLLAPAGMTRAIKATALGGQVHGVLTQCRAYPAHSLVAIPDHLAFEEASTLPCAALTAYNALVDGLDQVKAGDTVLIMGTGGVSIFALQFCVVSGATTIILSSSANKLNFAKTLGATHTINYSETPAWDAEVLKLTNGRGVDRVLDVVGNRTLARSIRVVRLGGCVDMIGAVGGQSISPPDIVGPAIWGQVRLRGSYVGAVSQFHAMNRLLAAHPERTRPVIDKVFSFEEAHEAFAYLESQQHVGKVVISVG